MDPTAGLKPATPRLVIACSLQLSYVGTGALYGVRTRGLRLDGPASTPLLQQGVVRALGLEPSLVRGKSPVPYQSGVARIVGREGIEPPVSDDGWFTASCAPWRVRPSGTGVATG